MTLNINKPLRVAPVEISARETASSFAVRSPRLLAWRSALTARMSGPGGAYNVGNLIGLCQGITAQILVSGDLNQLLWTGAPAAISHYLTGNFAAIAMTSATAIFFASGEIYHRAWNGRLKPRENLNRLGDFLSGVGAGCLGLALFELGHPLLALTSGLLHSVGKFGSACHRPGVRILNLSEYGPDPFRVMVLLSRLPALIAAGTGLCASLFKFEVEQPQHWSTPASLLVCYLLWSWADLLLFRSSQPRAARDHSAG
ncbi:hypothetical protein P3C58_01535 [Mesorhizobium sp. XAP10]|uniref:hypothetical protein n=1 Tax=unclassified Mesorhizobium TaxID=325217 RepID=UPI0023E040D7|nr:MULTISPECIES: hypothetical protein [unclassified Mesorhizobium]MDF3150653.1 hypothetical protein [Mesorhizobium sp. XAP10]MDF3243539.1 hypothetical protein [Mesorhizobium sp. XAP4]